MQQRYLELDTATNMIHLAVNGHASNRRLCKQDQATVATAGALMGFSAAVIEQQLKYFLARVVTVASEIELETRFSPEKLYKPLIRVVGLEPPFRTFLKDLTSGSAAGAVFTYIDRPEIKQCKKTINSALSKLIQAVDMLPKKAAERDRLRPTEIETLMKGMLKPKLLEVEADLGGALKYAKAIREKAETEWRDCVESLKKCC